MLGQHNIYASRIIPLKDGYVIITSVEEELDILFNASCQEAPRANGFSPTMPPDLKAKRTILLFGVDEDAYSHSLDGIKEEVYRVNEFNYGCIDPVYKLPSSKNIKITFCSTVPALKTQEVDIKMFYTRIPSHQIQQEEYFHCKTDSNATKYKITPPASAPEKRSTKCALNARRRDTHGRTAHLALPRKA